MGLSNREYQKLANEVSKRRSEFDHFPAAVHAVLNSHGIRDEHALHMSEIGKILGRRKKRRKKKQSRKEVFQEVEYKEALEGARQAERLHAGDPDIMEGYI